MLGHGRGAKDCSQNRQAAGAIAQGLVLKPTSIGDLPDVLRRDFNYDSKHNDHCRHLDKSVFSSGLHIHVGAPL
jgi:hypothetical protein